MTKSEYAVPLWIHNQTLFHSNIALRLRFEGGDFGALGRCDPPNADVSRLYGHRCLIAVEYDG